LSFREHQPAKCLFEAGDFSHCPEKIFAEEKNRQPPGGTAPGRMKKEKRKRKKEKGGKPPVDGWHRARKNYELSVGCLGKNYELRIWATDPHRLALISLTLTPLTLPNPATEAPNNE